MSVNKPGPTLQYPEDRRSAAGESIGAKLSIYTSTNARRDTHGTHPRRIGISTIILPSLPLRQADSVEEALVPLLRADRLMTSWLWSRGKPAPSAYCIAGPCVATKTDLGIGRSVLQLVIAALHRVFAV